MIGYYENMFAYAFFTGKCQNCISFPFSVTCLLVSISVFFLNIEYILMSLPPTSTAKK